MNSEPNAMTSRNHCEIATSAAAPPATARSRKPEETKAMSRTGWCLSPKQYMSCRTMYTATTIASAGCVNTTEIASEATMSTAAIA